MFNKFVCASANETNWPFLAVLLPAVPTIPVTDSAKESLFKLLAYCYKSNKLCSRVFISCSASLDFIPRRSI